MIGVVSGQITSRGSLQGNATEAGETDVETGYNFRQGKLWGVIRDPIENSKQTKSHSLERAAIKITHTSPEQNCFECD